MDSKTDGKAIAEAYAEGLKEGIKLINSHKCTISQAAQAIDNLAAAIREHTAALTQEESPITITAMYDLAGNPID